MDPSALSARIEGSKIIFAARGGEKAPVKDEEPTMAFAFASVVAIQDIAPGQLLSEENIWLKRPGGGDFTASDYENLLGKKALLGIRRGTQIRRTDIDD
jgi:N-acetylneuraminate synthase